MRTALVAGLFGSLLCYSLSSMAAEDLPIAKRTMPWPVAGASVKDTTQFFNQPSTAKVAAGDGCFQPASGGIGLLPSHAGINIDAAGNTDVTAIYPGVVREQGNSSAAGNYLLIESEAGAPGVASRKWVTLYAQLQSDGLPAANATVRAGDRIGKVMVQGSGRSHLHLGMWASAYTTGAGMAALYGCEFNSLTAPALDPLIYLQQNDWLLIDNSASRNTRRGNWETLKVSSRSANPAYHGDNYEAQDSQLAGQFSFIGTVVQPGRYKVYVRWPHPPQTAGARSTATVFGFQAGNLNLVSRRFDQGDPTTSGGWVEVWSNLNLSAGPLTLTVKADVAEAGRKIVADAVLLEKQ